MKNCAKEEKSGHCSTRGNWQNNIFAINVSCTYTLFSWCISV